MLVQTYIYKRSDPDLIALADAGYNLGDMARDAVFNYANQKPFRIYVPELIKSDLVDRRSIKVQFHVNDAPSKNLLKNIKTGLRSNFVKLCLRNALIQQNLCCFFTKESYIKLQKNDLESLPSEAYSNLVDASLYVNKTGEVTFMGKTVTYKNTEAEDENTVTLPVSKNQKPEKISILSQEERKSPEPVKAEPMPVIEEKKEPVPESDLSSDDIMTMFDNL